jgi:two-component system cell cycle sensor histidine kinase PleC
MGQGAAHTAAEAAAIDALPALPEALDALRVAITLFDSNERLIYCNRHFNQLFPSRPPRRALYGCTYTELIRLELETGDFAPPDEDMELAIACRRTHLQGSDFQPRDFTLNDGRIVEMKARRTHTGGWIALWNDVTEARRTTMQQEDLTTLAAEAFAVWDTNDRLVFCNAAYTAVHGQILNASFEEHIRGAVKDKRFAMDNAEEWIARRLQTHAKPLMGSHCLRGPAKPTAYARVLRAMAAARRCSQTSQHSVVLKRRWKIRLARLSGRSARWKGRRSK